MMIYFLRTLLCLIVIALGGAIAVGLENAILGILVSASGVLAIAMPLMIEDRVNKPVTKAERKDAADKWMEQLQAAVNK